MIRPIANPPNPWASEHVEWLDDEPPPEARLEVYEEQARSLLVSNDSPDVPFRWSANPYRGCFHACSYCYARPGHQYLGFGAGTDFERRIVVKVNAPALLRRELSRPSWRGETLTLSGVTDCYQPLEACYRVTRGILETCLEFRQPVAIITKGALVRRDLDLLARLAREARAAVFVSIPFADRDTARKLEPSVAPPQTRFETLRRLADAGVPCGLALAPVIPGLNDSQIPDLLERAAAAGARAAFMTLLRLPAEVAPVFRERFAEAFPDRVVKVESLLRELRGGALYRAGFGERMRGAGPRWQMIEQVFEAHCRRLGLNQEMNAGADAPDPPTTFRRPSAQQELYR